MEAGAAEAEAGGAGSSAGAEEDGEEVVIEELEPGQAASSTEGPAEDDGPQAGEDEPAGEGTDDEMKKIEKEKEKLSATEKLERSFLYKIEGNEFFKKNDVFRAADCYYRAVLYARELMQNPKYYPNLGHNEAQRETARGLVESIFTNLALVQSKYGITLAKGDEREKVLLEGAKSAAEALKVNGNNVKALYRRGLCRSRLAQDAAGEALGGGAGSRLQRAQELCAEAKADLVAAVKADEQNRDARKELKAVQDLTKRLRQEEVSRDKKEFSFAGSLSALQQKEQDVLGDGSVRKLQVLQQGDGARWFNEDWLQPQAKNRCVVHVRCRLLRADSTETQLVIFALGDPAMHEGIRIAVRHMTKGEMAHFAIAPRRLAPEAPLAKRLPAVPAEEESTWELELVKFAVYEDREGDGSQLLKVHSEGYGHFAQPLAECHLHWKVTGSDDKTLHSSRLRVSIGEEGGIKQSEDEDRAPCVYVMGENMWPPVAALCKFLRQGGQGELRLKKAPEIPEKDPGAPEDAVSAKLGAALNRRTGGTLHDVAVHVELVRVVLPLQGPGDPNWGGTATLVEERFRAEQLLEAGEDAAALQRFRRGCAWAEQALAAEHAEDAARELLALRQGLAWVLARRAAPILDLGTVSSDVLRAAEADLREAEAHCDWLDKQTPGLPGARLVRAKVLVARDDDWSGANAELMQAQRDAPDDVRIQRELKVVRVELRKEQEAKSRERVSALRDALAAARERGLLGAEGGEARAAELLAELAATRVSWEVVMETRVGAELKRVQEASGDPATKKLCKDILGRWMEESKEQRPMWD